MCPLVTRKTRVKFPAAEVFQALPCTWACNSACLVSSTVAPTATLFLQWKRVVPNKIRSARIELANGSWQFAAIESPPCSVCTSCGLVLVQYSWFVCVGLSFVWCLAAFVLTNGEAALHSASCLRVRALCVESCCAWNRFTSVSC